MSDRVVDGRQIQSVSCPAALDLLQLYQSIHDTGAVFNAKLTPIALGSIAKQGCGTFVHVNVLAHIDEQEIEFT